MYQTNLDLYIPWISLVYGFTLLVFPEIPVVNKFAESKAPQFISVFESHRKIAMICLFVGGLWTLQNTLG
jgi:hypothetical protein